jgi:hypothetical protein
MLVTKSTIHEVASSSALKDRVLLKKFLRGSHRGYGKHKNLILLLGLQED